MPHTCTKNLLDFIAQSPTAGHAAGHIARTLTDQGFQGLSEKDRWHLDAEGKYFVRRGDSALIAFIIGKQPAPGTGFRGVAAHLDSPALKLKLAAAKADTSTRTAKAGVEVYGGPIVSTWIDRPLHLAGRITLLGPDGPEPKNLFTPDPVAIIANAAIHLNRDINKGFKYNPQDHLTPVFATGEAVTDQSLRNFLADELQVEADMICEADLFLVCSGGTVLGIDQSLIAAPRLDDLAMANAILSALTTVQSPDRTVLGIFADHEEIGSKTPGGADSTFLESTLKHLTVALGGDAVDTVRMGADAFLISADMAHAVHPAYKDKHDPAYAPVINGGPVIKSHAGMKYTTTAEGAAMFRHLCKSAGIPVQSFIPKSDQPTGSTVGPIIAGRLGIPSMDIGSPLWAMHSSMETAGVSDQHWMIQALTAFFKN